MKLSEQFQARLFSFYEKILSVKKHQNAKQTILTLLEVFVRAKNCCLCCLVFTCFCFVSWFWFDLCAQNFTMKKISRLKTVLITSKYNTTHALSLLYLNFHGFFAIYCKWLTFEIDRKISCCYIWWLDYLSLGEILSGNNNKSDKSIFLFDKSIFLFLDLSFSFWRKTSYVLISFVLLIT